MFIETFHLVTNRSRCADFSVRHDRPQLMCVPSIFTKLQSALFPKFLGNAGLGGYTCTLPKGKKPEQGVPNTILKSYISSA